MTPFQTLWVLISITLPVLPHNFSLHSGPWAGMKLFNVTLASSLNKIFFPSRLAYYHHQFVPLASMVPWVSSAAFSHTTWFSHRLILVDIGSSPRVKLLCTWPRWILHCSYCEGERRRK
ncbi:hypothetical protein ASPWEDRAFT_548639 [Aspergillus wentii DTO 134E9]|uniref:Secreted protein n=1 Tax=Aspergillus wentii DTO 134E9 TaxID=1073089 RepID=A0A1L9RG44_ASPWE|nr:uncharacterized protein ASPWEDRAFT_548639 [Aspergillus wentii DTO 134E9]OJJ33902.1 hypothetical protein ASPWEDRAFT_548639 [Aspergillus wentii DTO 134E9]